MAAVKWVLVVVECLAGALLLIAIYMNYQDTREQIKADLLRGSWDAHFHERIWEFESDDGHGGASTDRPEG